jgi:hypothetical protein
MHPRVAPPARRCLLLGLAGMGMGLLIGCGGPEFARVSGTVTLNGKPLNDVEVRFLPDPEKGNPGPTASAFTDRQGHYELRCERPPKNGTILGFHRVCILDITAIARSRGMPGGPDVVAGAPGADKAPAGIPIGPAPRVPAVYNNVSLTPFRDIEVKPGAQTLDLDVKSGKK